MRDLLFFKSYHLRCLRYRNIKILAFKHYKIRETGVRATIARMLHCTGQRQYEALVVHLLKTDAAFSDAMRADFGALSGELSA